jgi:hypothetical protein
LTLTLTRDDPYTAITRIGQGSAAQYPILCHQDVYTDRGAGAAELLAVLRQLDEVDADWVVAGNAGVMRSGRLIRRLTDSYGSPTGERFAAPRRDTGRGLPRFQPPQRFIASWNDSSWLLYVITTCDTLFLSRSRLLRRLLGSSRAMSAVEECRHQGQHGSPLRPIDRPRRFDSSAGIDGLAEPSEVVLCPLARRGDEVNMPREAVAEPLADGLPKDVAEARAVAVRLKLGAE